MKAEKLCNKCKSKTHNTKDCRARRDGAKMAAETGEENAKIHSFAFTLKENNSIGGKTSNLLVDTGATSHIINDKSKFVNFDEKFDPSNHVIELADGSKANVVLGKGNAKVKLYDVNGNLQDIMLSNALYIPSYQQNIFSVPAARGRLLSA
jgi:predicted aspartyl protease